MQRTKEIEKNEEREADKTHRNEGKKRRKHKDGRSKLMTKFKKENEILSKKAVIYSHVN